VQHRTARCRDDGSANRPDRPPRERPIPAGDCSIVANTELQERELIKLAALSAALADTLRRRGVTDPAASLTAEAGIAVFKIAFERWINETNQQDFAQLIRDTLDELKALTAGNDHRAKVEREVMPAAGSVSVTGLSSQRGEDTRS
jgi:hypothetical protein